MKSFSQKTKALPDNPGIYKFINQNGQIIYVGKAKSLKKRVASYFSKRNLGPKTNLMVSQINKMKIIKVFSEFEALLLEAELIKKYQPFFNVQAKDDKSPLYIKITGGEIPLVSTTRRQIPQKGVFLVGPFQSSKTAKEILKMTRKIFPYCQHKNPKKPCLFVHLGLCPYPYDDYISKQKYIKNISYIKKMLRGKNKVLTANLKRVMQNLSSTQKYEEANSIKMQLQKLQFLSNSYHLPWEFLEQPTLVDDLVLTKLKDLQKTLGLEKMPKRIECYDISNIQGKSATGSMIVFEDGKRARDQYRRFKIKFSRKPNDYLMLAEVLTRRLKNDWPKPDLIVIDGGRGQLNSARNVLGKNMLNIPIISLAKRLEEIYTTQKTVPISLPKQSPSRQLVEQLRDEAHRFAINYHRLLRSKQFLAKS